MPSPITICPADEIVKISDGRKAKIFWKATEPRLFTSALGGVMIILAVANCVPLLLVPPVPPMPVPGVVVAPVNKLNVPEQSRFTV